MKLLINVKLGPEWDGESPTREEVFKAIADTLEEFGGFLVGEIEEIVERIDDGA